MKSVKLFFGLVISGLTILAFSSQEKEITIHTYSPSLEAWLKQKGYSINVEHIDKEGYAGETALHLACREGKYDFAQELLDHGANFNIQWGSVSNLVALRIIRTHYEQSHENLSETENQKRMSLIHRLIHSKGHNIDAQDSTGWTALMRAVDSLDILFVKKLLNNGARNLIASYHIEAIREEIHGKVINIKPNSTVFDIAKLGKKYTALTILENHRDDISLLPIIIRDTCHNTSPLPTGVISLITGYVGGDIACDETQRKKQKSGCRIS